MTTDRIPEASSAAVHPDRRFLVRLTKTLGILLIALLVFWAGTMVGWHEAQYGFRWDSHYRDSFFGSDSPFGLRAMATNDRDVMFSANGAAGEIVAVNLPSVAVKGDDEPEKVVLISPKTVIRRIGASASTTDIRAGDVMIAIGEPDQNGRIVATFVRLLPPPPTSTPRNR